MITRMAKVSILCIVYLILNAATLVPRPTAATDRGIPLAAHTGGDDSNLDSENDSSCEGEVTKNLQTKSDIHQEIPLLHP